MEAPRGGQILDRKDLVERREGIIDISKVSSQGRWEGMGSKAEVMGGSQGGWRESMVRTGDRQGFGSESWVVRLRMDHLLSSSFLR